MNSPIDQQHLPDPGEVEVLEALEPEPVRRGALEHAVDAEERADQRAEHDHRQRAEQRERQLALVLGLAPGDHRREEDARGHERGGDPEQRELHVPGAHQVVREDRREVEAEEARRARRGSAARRRRRTSGCRNSAAITKKNHAQARWAGVSATSPGARNDRLACSRPCQPRKRQRPNAPNRIPMPPSSAISESTLQTITLAVGPVVDARLGRPVVGVGVVVARAVGRAGPRGPAEERGQLAQLGLDR